MNLKDLKKTKRITKYRRSKKVSHPNLDLQVSVKMAKLKLYGMSTKIQNRFGSLNSGQRYNFLDQGNCEGNLVLDHLKL